MDPDVLLFRNGGHFHLVHLVRFRFLVVRLLIVKRERKATCWDSTKMHFGKNKEALWKLNLFEVWFHKGSFQWQRESYISGQRWPGGILPTKG